MAAQAAFVLAVDRPTAMALPRHHGKVAMSRPSPAAARTIAVLNFFVEHPLQAFTLTDLIKSLRLSRATCHALLGTLVDAGYLYRKPDKSYIIGPTLVAAGRIARRHYSPLEIAREEMRGLADEFDAICAAMFRDKGDLVLRDRAGGMSHLGWLPPIGQRVTLMTLWGGPSLAWDSDTAIREWEDHVSAGARPEELAKVQETMRAARARGYHFAIRQDNWSSELLHAPVDERRQYNDMSVIELDDEMSYTPSFVMAPVMDESGVAFVISLSGFRSEMTGAQIKQTGQAVVDACRRVSEFIIRAGNDSEEDDGG